MSALPPLLVLAGGFGTRLRTAVAEVPKPLAPVVGRPYLYHFAAQCVADGLNHFIFLLHHQAERIQEFLAEEAKGVLRDATVETIIEPQPMGTGGALAYAVRERRLEGSFLVANADTWIGSGLTQVARHPVAALGVVHVEDSGRYGRVRCEDDRVIAFTEKQTAGGPGWINAGVYHLSTDSFRDWHGRPFSLEKEMLPGLVMDQKLRAVPLGGDFIDIGIPEDYFRFCRWMENEKRSPL